MMNIVFLDIETCPEYDCYHDLPEDGKASYAKKFGKDDGVVNFKGVVTSISGQLLIDMSLDAALNEHYQKNAGFHAEYSRIVCISIGAIVIDGTSINKDDKMVFIKAITGTEEEILNGLVESLAKLNPERLVAHNGKNFDFPFIAKRMRILGIKVPHILNTIGKKPWDVNLDDTMEMWRGTDFKGYASLITLCYVFKIPTPKDDMSGAMVPEAFRKGEVARIAKYCNQDVDRLIRIWFAIMQIEFNLKVQIADVKQGREKVPASSAPADQTAG